MDSSCKIDMFYLKGNDYEQSAKSHEIFSKTVFSMIKIVQI